jgi:hypothetical protein
MGSSIVGVALQRFPQVLSTRQQTALFSEASISSFRMAIALTSQRALALAHMYYEYSQESGAQRASKISCKLLKLSNSCSANVAVR